MTNRARPTWPDGAGSAKKSPGTPPGTNGNGNGQPAPPTTPGSDRDTADRAGGSEHAEAPGVSPTRPDAHDQGGGRPSTDQDAGHPSTDHRADQPITDHRPAGETDVRAVWEVVVHDGDDRGPR